MTGSGDYLIVGKPFDRRWIAWGGGLDKWVPFGDEMRFSNRQEAEEFLKDARKDAEHQEIGLGNAVYVACVQLRTWKVLTGLVYHAGNEVKVDFTDDDYSCPRQMDELGVL